MIYHDSYYRQMTEAHFFINCLININTFRSYQTISFIRLENSFYFQEQDPKY